MAVFNNETPGMPTVMLASLMAAGTGINLLGASNVILCDPWWNPSVENQAIDRVHRIGKTAPVDVYRMVVAGSIEERLLEVHEAKEQLATVTLKVQDNKALDNMKAQLLSALFGTALHVRGRRGELEVAGGPPIIHCRNDF
jgi:SNF2 family DNA or RNA helicase